MHRKLLEGSTSKEVLEVFYQEGGIRLIPYAVWFRRFDLFEISLHIDIIF